MRMSQAAADAAPAYCQEFYTLFEQQAKALRSEQKAQASSPLDRATGVHAAMVAVMQADSRPARREGPPGTADRRLQ